MLKELAAERKRKDDRRVTCSSGVWCYDQPVRGIGHGRDRVGHDLTGRRQGGRKGRSDCDTRRGEGQTSMLAHENVGLEIKGRWNHTAKRIPGVRNSLADGTSRSPRVTLADKVRQLTNSDDWSQQDFGTRG